MLACPRCGGTEVEEASGRLYCDRYEHIDVTHRCLKCKTEFRYELPTPGVQKKETVAQ